MQIVHHHFASLSSTQAYAQENLSTFDPRSLTLISADEQTKGQGQGSKSWVSPKLAGIYATLVFSTSEDPFLLTRSLAECVIKWLETHKVIATFKWPNDVQVNGKKIAGVLTNSSPPWMLIGLGFNLNLQEERLETIDQPATSLFNETKRELDPKKALMEIVACFKAEVLLDRG